MNSETSFPVFYLNHNSRGFKRVYRISENMYVQAATLKPVYKPTIDTIIVKDIDDVNEYKYAKLLYRVRKGQLNLALMSSFDKKKLFNDPLYKRALGEYPELFI